MDEHSLQGILEKETARWMLWGINDWREMVEATVDDEDGELFFYVIEHKGETYPIEVVCSPNPEGGMDVALTLIIEEGEWEPGADWTVHPDGRIEMIDAGSEGEEEGGEEDG